MDKITAIKAQLLNIKVAILFLTFSILAFTLPNSVFAQTSTTATDTLTPLPAYVSPTSPIYTDLIINNIFHSISCIGTGHSVIGQPCLSYQTLTDAQGVIKSVPMLAQTDLSGGILGASTKIITALYLNPPVNTASYLATVKQNLGFAKEADAQVNGSGANVLDPLVSLWQVSRNVAYLIMVVVFVVIGLMIIFRKRLNPQTVVSAQSALPGLVIGLLLITFSYFLASLITDFAFIGTDLVGFYFSQAQPNVSVPAGSSLIDRTKNTSLVAIYSTLIDQQQATRYGEAAGAIVDNFQSGGNSLNTFFPPSPRTIIGFIAAFINQQYLQLITPVQSGGTTLLCGLAAGLLPFATGDRTGKFSACTTIADSILKTIESGSLAIAGDANKSGTIGNALYIAAVIALIFSLVKLAVRLIQSYLTIIFLTITSPFTFLLSSLPGRQGMATNWVMNMLSNILAFPAVFAIFYFIAYINGPDNRTDAGSILGFIKTAQAATDTTIINTTFGIKAAGDLTAGYALPLFGGLSKSLITNLLSFVALVSLPAIPDIVSKSIGKFGEAGSIIERSYSSASSQGQGYLRQSQSGAEGAGRDIMGMKQPFMGSTSYLQEEGGPLKKGQMTPSPINIVRQKIGG